MWRTLPLAKATLLLCEKFQLVAGRSRCILKQERIENTKARLERVGDAQGYTFRFIRFRSGK